MSHLPPLMPADLPPKTRSFWRLVGPGAILVGLSIGSGELIIWPRITAEFGAAMTWAPLLGVFTQLWVNLELGRYTIATGESVYTGFARISKFFAYFFSVMVVVITILPAWAVASGSTLKALIVGIDGPGDLWVWTWITFAAILLILLGPKRLYHAFEKTEMVLVAITTLGLIILVMKVADANVLKEVGRGVVNLGFIDDKMNFQDFFGAMVFAGIGGAGNIFLCFYLRDKNIGMGALLPKVLNPLRGKEEKMPQTGHCFEETPENISNWRKWFNHFRLDQTLFFWFLNTFTILLFIIGSLAVLHPRGLVPAQDRLVVTQAQLLQEIMGEPGRIIFLLVAFASLFSVQLGIIDGNARSLSDILYCNFPRAQGRSLGWWYLAIVIGWVLVGSLLSTAKFPPWAMFITCGCLNGVTMAVYCPLTLYINYKYLPRAARPGVVHTFFLIWAALLYASFSVCLLIKLLKMI